MAAETSHTCHLQAGSPGRLVEQLESPRAGAVGSGLCPADQSGRGRVSPALLFLLVLFRHPRGLGGPHPPREGPLVLFRPPWIGRSSPTARRAMLTQSTDPNAHFLPKDPHSLTSRLGSL